MAEHVRIDEGIKRPRKTHPPRAALSGQFKCTVSPERKTEIIEAALEAITNGRNTDQIGEQFGIPGRTLRYWLLNDDRAHAARKAMVDQELIRTGEELRLADAPLPLARAREEFRYWSWIAERRDAQRYGLQTHVTVEHVGDLGDRLRRARERTIEGEVVTDTIPVLSPPSDTPDQS